MRSKLRNGFHAHTQRSQSWCLVLPSRSILTGKNSKQGTWSFKNFTYAGELELSSQKRQKYSRVGSHVWSFCHMWSFFPYKAAQPLPSSSLMSVMHIFERQMT